MEEVQFVSFFKWEFVMSTTFKINHFVELFLLLETNSSTSFAQFNIQMVYFCKMS